MKKSNYYINGIGMISPQRTFNNDEFLPEITQYHANKLDCVVPDFKEYINPIQLRRLSRMLRVGLSSAVICLRDSKNVNPDGIITATGYGFLGDTARFLSEIYQYQENQLTPTYFIQSTYNALAGLVALTLKCKGYNNTYVNRGFAFETALHDAMMQLNAGSGKTLLVGAYDERDDAQYKIHARLGYYKEEHIDSLTLFDHKTDGTLQGEGASFFSISGNVGENVWAQLIDIKMIFKPESDVMLENDLNTFLSSHQLSVTDIDVVVNGMSGDSKKDTILHAMMKSKLRSIPEVRFKHLCGEFSTASSFGTWLGASILKRQCIPDGVKFNAVQAPLVIQYALIVNQYMDNNYTFILLKSVSI